MGSALRLLGSYLSASLRGQMQYAGSTLALTLGNLLTTVIDILAAWALFHRFGAVQGWTFGDIALFFGLVSMGFALADFATRGFNTFGETFVRTGDFDRILLRPRAAALQIAGHDLRLSRFGRFAQGLVVVIVASVATGLPWTAQTVLIAIWAVAGAAALFTGLMILQATLAFWTVESLEAMNVLTYGGVQAAQYPLSLYAEWFRNFLIFVVPVGCVAYFPVLAILGRSDPLGAPDWILPLTPLAGFGFLGLSLLIWRVGVARYTSTGS